MLPYLYQSSAVLHLENDVDNAPSNGAIWDEFSEQQQYLIIKKHHI